MSEDVFLDTVLRTEHLTERDWLELIKQRQQTVLELMPDMAWANGVLTRLVDVPCIPGQEAHSPRRALASLPWPESFPVFKGRGLFLCRPPRRSEDDCTSYIVGFTENRTWLAVCVYLRKCEGKPDQFDEVKQEISTPSHIVEMAKVSYGDLWFLLGQAIEDLAKRRREELELLNALAERVKMESRIIVAIETDHKVTR